jgi:hypothetical protein
MRASAKLGQLSASCIMASLAERELPGSRERLINLLHPRRRAPLARQGALTAFKRDRRDYLSPTMSSSHFRNPTCGVCCPYSIGLILCCPALQP